MKIPRWVSPLEAFIKPTLLTENKKEPYEKLLDKNNKLKSLQQLQLLNINLTWWESTQFKSIYSKDKTLGFYTARNELDKIWLSCNDKMIQKIYKFLLENYMQDDVVKSSMIAWMQDIGYNIDFDDWAKIWKTMRFLRAMAKLTMLIYGTLFQRSWLRVYKWWENNLV